MNNNQEIISKLKFIGKIQKGEKIHTKHMYVQPDSLTTSLSRTFLYPDKRTNTLEFIKETITRAFELLITYERSDKAAEKMQFNLLVGDLRSAALGLKNLKVTYVDDTKFCCDIDTILEFIDTNLIPFSKDVDVVVSETEEETAEF